MTSKMIKICGICSILIVLLAVPLVCACDVYAAQSVTADDDAVTISISIKDPDTGDWVNNAHVELRTAHGTMTRDTHIGIAMFTVPRYKLGGQNPTVYVTASGYRSATSTVTVDPYRGYVSKTVWLERI